jgi:hypothetical protein
MSASTIAAVWLAIGLFDATQTVVVMRSEGMHHDWVKLFGVQVASWLPWLFATPAVVWLGRRFPVLPLRPSAGWLVHPAACVAIGALFAAWQTGLVIPTDPYLEHPAWTAFWPNWRGDFLNGILSSIILYAGILTVSTALESRARLALEQTAAAQLNEQLTHAQLCALRRQIEPHFLFNALNAIAGLVRDGRSGDAVTTIVGLSDLLRRSLHDGAQSEVPLSEEMAFARQYLDIQKVRFADRLELSIDVPGEFASTPVPYLLLQPLVENAVKHGIARRAQGGAIRISAARSAGTLILRVCNDGPDLPAQWETNGTGIGIANIRSRLQHLYGDAYGVSLRNQSTGGVEAAVRLPLPRERRDA